MLRYAASTMKTVHLLRDDGLPSCKKLTRYSRPESWADYTDSLDFDDMRLRGYRPCLSCAKNSLWGFDGLSSQCYSAAPDEFSSNPYRPLNADQEERRGYVYLMWAVGTFRYKIGYSANPEFRLYQLNQRQSPYPIEMIHCFPAIDMVRDEGILKRAFYKYRVHNEWYELPLEAVELIKLIKEGFTNGQES